jgi:glyoxylase-like metal-dependent hydrolase (beta-lactamase superfamily II)
MQRPDPLIHPEKNGSSEGWIETAKGMVKLDSDQFVPGHGDLQTKAQVEQRLKFTEEKRAKIKKLVAEGKSLEEIKAAVGDPPPPAPAAGGRGGAGIPQFTDVVYNELTKTGKTG